MSNYRKKIVWQASVAFQMSPLLNASDNKALKWHSSNDPILIAPNQTVRYQLPSPLIVKVVQLWLSNKAAPGPSQPTSGGRFECTLDMRRKKPSKWPRSRSTAVNFGEYEKESLSLRAGVMELRGRTPKSFPRFLTA